MPSSKKDREALRKFIDFLGITEPEGVGKQLKAGHLIEELYAV
jgi:hypothetical protein